MKLSIYTFVRDGIYFDYHIQAMLRHHLALADEIVVVEGFSRDGTYERIKDLDARIKVVRQVVDPTDAKTWLMRAKNEARVRCQGDWCLLLDCDEFVPEWEFERLRQYLSGTCRDFARVRFRHFYANYKVCLRASDRTMPPALGVRIHRNLADAEVWGDGANVRLQGGQTECDEDVAFDCHHFGEVRRAARLRHKWRQQYQREVLGKWDRLPAFLFRLFPHRWLDPGMLKELEVYPGPYLQAVRDDPAEFVRDGFKVYRHLAGTK